MSRLNLHMHTSCFDPTPIVAPDVTPSVAIDVICRRLREAHHAQHTQGSQTTSCKLTTPVRLRSSCLPCDTHRSGVPLSSAYAPPLVRGLSPIPSGAVPHAVAPILGYLLQKCGVAPKANTDNGINNQLLPLGSLNSPTLTMALISTQPNNFKSATLYPV